VGKGYTQRHISGTLPPFPHSPGAPLYDIILRDATLVSSSGRQVADVAIKNGKIAYVGPRPRHPGREEINAIGKFLMPGVIDTAVLFDPEGTVDVWERESRAAVSGGITTVVALPDGPVPVTDQRTAIARAEQTAGKSWCNFGLWADASTTAPEELARALEQRDVVGALLGVNDGHEAATQDRLSALLGLPGVVGVRLNRQARDAGGVQSVVDLVRGATRQVHLVHLSTAEELTALDPVLGEVPVTAGVTPHHLFLSTDTAPDPVTYRTLPPVRQEQDRRTLWTAMKRGRLDCVASDHHTTPDDDGGVPGSELMFPLMLSAVRYGRLSLEGLVSLCSEGPARIFGLPNKGHITRGADADLVLFSEGELATIGESNLLSGAGWSPYLNREAAPKPDVVVVNGVIAAKRGKIVASGPSGQKLA